MRRGERVRGRGQEGERMVREGEEGEGGEGVEKREGERRKGAGDA